jgi:ABC-type nitrate/sulfonate/bicarbonate transport system substrate-binding protein
MSPVQLPLPEKSRLRIGYMRLSDSAPLILALEQGLYAAQGLEVELVREVSWANLRDRLALGDLDAAQLLAPLPLMTTLGAGGLREALLTGLVLSLNGNALTVSTRLWQSIGVLQPDGMPDPLASSRRLRDWLRSGQGLPTFATVHLFSMHTLQLRLWLRAGGIDPDHEVKIIVLPPEQMADSLARGVIDGYCVGEPWSSLAVQQGSGAIVATGNQLWNNAPEKVLAVTARWHQHHAATHLRLRLALMAACAALADPAVCRDMAEVLAQPRYLDLPASLLLPSLGGALRFVRQQSAAIAVPDFHVFARYQAGFPWRSSAALMLQHCGFALGRPISEEDAAALAQQCYRPDLYREAARCSGLPCPSQDLKPENCHATAWEIEPGIVLGPDLQLQGS